MTLFECTKGSLNVTQHLCMNSLGVFACIHSLPIGPFIYISLYIYQKDILQTCTITGCIALKRNVYKLTHKNKVVLGIKTVDFLVCLCYETRLICDLMQTNRKIQATVLQNTSNRMHWKIIWQRCFSKHTINYCFIHLSVV